MRPFEKRRRGRGEEEEKEDSINEEREREREARFSVICREFSSSWEGWIWISARRPLPLSRMKREAISRASPLKRS